MRAITLPLAVVVSSALLTYHDSIAPASSSLPYQIRMPKTHHPTPTIQFEAPSSITTLNAVLKHDAFSSVDKLTVALNTSYEFTLLVTFHLLSVTFLLHKLLRTTRGLGLEARKDAIMTWTKRVLLLCVAFPALMYQRHAFWLALQRSWSENGGAIAASNLSTMLLLFSRLRWLVFAIALFVHAKAYQLYMLEIPDTMWELPAFLGGKESMIVTVLVFAGGIFTVGVAVPSMTYFLGLGADLYRLAVVMQGLHACFLCLPNKWRKVFEKEGPGRPGDRKKKKKTS